MFEHFKFSLFRNGEASDERVAQGIVFFNGKVALALMAEDQPIIIYDSFKAMMRANCGNGQARLVWGYSEMAHSRHFLPSLEDPPVR